MCKVIRWTDFGVYQLYNECFIWNICNLLFLQISNRGLVGKLINYGTSKD